MINNSNKKKSLENQQAVWSRFWIYQKERFPLIAHGPLILSFSFCAVSISARLRAQEWPAWESVMVAFVSALIFFLQLRIADEFKDAEEDAKYRPYRAVPRGLVKLSELAILFALGALVQLLLALWLNFMLGAVLLVVWCYLGAMSVEFGVPKWLKAHPITYLWTHMLIMPLIDLYASATDWIMGEHPLPPDGLVYFLIASFFNGIVIEIGRKIRVESQEEEGVETYSLLWGCKKAAIVWWLMVAITLVFGCLAAHRAGAFIAVSVVLASLALVLGIFVVVFVTKESEKRAKMFETAAGIWTLCLYLSIGLLPGILHHV
jgi:4-hydroxybenzoate polyprenyltransferase